MLLSPYLRTAYLGLPGKLGFPAAGSVAGLQAMADGPVSGRFQKLVQVPQGQRSCSRLRHDLHISPNHAASIDGTPSSSEMGANTGSLQRAIKHATCQEDVYVLVTQQITQSLSVKFPQAPFIITL